MTVLQIVLFLLFLLLLGGLFDAPFLPTSKKDFKKIADIIEAKKEKVVYDLGSGTGSLLFYLNKNYGVRGVGVEISPLLYFFSKIKSLYIEGVDIRYGNFRKTDLSKADVVYVFLTPLFQERAKKEILPKMKQGAELLVCGSEVDELSPVKLIREAGEQSYYLYKK